MPWLDWQFYVVTAAALWGAWTLLRQLLPRPGPAGPACGACGAGACGCAVKRPPIAAEAPGPPLVTLEHRRAPERKARR